MILRKPLFLIIFLSIVAVGYAQNVSESKTSCQYRMIRLDSTYDSRIDKNLQKYVNKKRNKMDKKMQEVIYHTESELESYPPESPLSNLLTDILRGESPKYTNDSSFTTVDLSLLNFGGIRTSMPAGDVTVGDIYKITPFDNYITYILLKGSELRKMFERFSESFNAPYSGAVITYKNGHPTNITINGDPLDDNMTYSLVTLNFISDGGDNIMSGLNFEKVEYTTITFRNFLITEFKSITASGKSMPTAIDGRAVKH